ncbi:MAG: M50 family metallopeptidase [Anaerolineaceae bacterium]|nr:M50 family metallopeptidase [Anaerolineaceae bacterium]
MNSTLNLLLNIVEFIIALGILAGLHEFGHFVMARISHIEVEEFGLGFPPRLVKLFNWHGTDFTLNWIPFGAFVRPKGENDPEIAGGLGAANPWKRLSVLLGGPVMNLLIGVFIFSLVFAEVGQPDSHTVQVLDTSPNSPAAQAGLLAGDIITQINSQKINSIDVLNPLVHSNIGKSIVITFLRKGQQHKVTIVPRANPPAGQGALGIVIGNPMISIGWFQAVPYAFQITYQQIRQLILLPGNLIRGQIAPAQARIVGPKGMFDIYQQARTLDQQAASTAGSTGSRAPDVNTLALLATISVALGLTNLLPLPALDGGRIIFLIPEILFRKRVPARYENMVHLIGFAALLLFMIYVTTQDIINPIVLP